MVIPTKPGRIASVPRVYTEAPGVFQRNRISREPSAASYSFQLLFFWARAQPVCLSAVFQIRPSKSAGVLDFFCIYQNITRVHAAEWGRNSFPYTSPRGSGNFFGLQWWHRCSTTKFDSTVARTVARTRALPNESDKGDYRGQHRWASRWRNVSVRTTKMCPFAGLSWSCAPVCTKQRTSIETFHVRRRCLFTWFSFVDYDVTTTYLNTVR